MMNKLLLTTNLLTTVLFLQVLKCAFCFSASGGLTLREGLTLMEDVHLSGCLKGLDLVEVNPALAK